MVAVLLGQTACSGQKQTATEGVTKEQFPISERIEESRIYRRGLSEAADLAGLRI